MYVTCNVMRLTHDVVHFARGITDVICEVMYDIVLLAIEQL